MAQSPTVDGEVLPVLVDRRGEPEFILLAAATIALTLTATATDVSAQWRRRGWGWGPGVAAGVIGGVVIAGANIASRPQGYVVYRGFAQPVYGPGCYWASQPLRRCGPLPWLCCASAACFAPVKMIG
jgi:hypothetical protein